MFCKKIHGLLLMGLPPIPVELVEVQSKKKMKRKSKSMNKTVDIFWSRNTRKQEQEAYEALSPDEQCMEIEVSEHLLKKMLDSESIVFKNELLYLAYGLKESRELKE